MFYDVGIRVVELANHTEGSTLAASPLESSWSPPQNLSEMHRVYRAPAPHESGNQSFKLS